MKHLKVIFYLFFLIFSLASCLHHTPSNPSKAQSSAPGTATMDELVQELMDVSGFNGELDNLPEVILGVMFPTFGNKEREADPLRDKFENLLQKEYDNSGFHQSIQKKLIAQLQRDEINFLLQWYRSDLARQIKASEDVDEEDGSFYMQMIFFSADAENPRNSKERHELISQILELNGSYDLALRLSDNSRREKIVCFAKMLGLDEKVVLEEFGSDKTLNLEDRKKKTQEWLLSAVVFFYRDFTDEQLQTYLVHCQHLTALKYKDLVSRPSRSHGLSGKFCHVSCQSINAFYHKSEGPWC